MPRWMRLGRMLLPTLLALAPVPDRTVTAAPAAPDTLAPPPPAVRAWQLGPRPDRLQHAGLAFTIGLGAGLVTRRAGPAAAAPCALGLLKEVRDARQGGFDTLDLAADALGAALAALAAHAATR